MPPITTSLRSSNLNGTWNTQCLSINGNLSKFTIHLLTKSDFLNTLKYIYRSIADQYRIKCNKDRNLLTYNERKHDISIEPPTKNTNLLCKLTDGSIKRTFTASITEISIQKYCYLTFIKDKNKDDNIFKCLRCQQIY